MSEVDWLSVYQDDVYHLQLSFEGGHPCAHTRVWGKVTPSNFKTYKEAFKETCFYLDALGFDFLMSVTPNLRFVKLLVGEKLELHSKILGRDVVYINLEDYLYG